MILSVHKEVQEQVAAAVRAHYGLAEAPPFAIEVPPNRALGDLAVTGGLRTPRRRLSAQLRAFLRAYLGGVGEPTPLVVAGHG